MGGKQLRLFLADGVPGGLTTLEIGNWTGRLVLAPRSKLKELAERDEAQRPGVYFLLGEDGSAVENLRCYIGETDEIRGRLRQHHDPTRGKDFWTRVVIVTSKDDHLTKAHTRFLESRLLELAHKAQRCTLDNSNNPAFTGLPEADRSDMEYFIDQLKIALPMLSVNVLRGSEPTILEKVDTQSISPIFELSVAKRGIHAYAQQIDGEFTVLEGSSVALPVEVQDNYSKSTRSAYALAYQKQQKLLSDGSVEIAGKVGRTTRNIVFGSPSSAGTVVTGRSSNGRTSWKTAEGLSFGQWEDGQ